LHEDMRWQYSAANDLTLPADIEGTRKHEGYVEVLEDENGLQKEIEAPAQEVIHKPLLDTSTKAKRGRKPRNA
jgi:hypothetical protein